MSLVTLGRLRPTPFVAARAIDSRTLGIMSKVYIHNASVDSKVPLKVFGGRPTFVSLQLASCQMVNHNTKRLRFKLPSENAISGLPLTYQPGFLDLLVKHYPQGKQSTHIHSLEPGQKLLFAAALPGYPWKPNSFPNVAMIAGGVGITPIYQLARGILSNPEDKTAISLISAANTDQDLVLKDELDKMQSEYADRVTVTYIVANPAIESPCRGGRLTHELHEQVATWPKDRNTMVFMS
ncbi:oxidoreductase NAD-binding domain-containing [Fusarium albosuccineum]|uniref:Oxidoreductase NAD-binding domain-containing n=1 Tax=Fusarium albosuccineum TaxID=1237068 RepID=A0A8H4LJN7_9HYPO|nr:oxidoreductase NAD-binding domain-containing [Fusarium albosuccineum]